MEVTVQYARCSNRLIPCASRSLKRSRRSCFVNGGRPFAVVRRDLGEAVRTNVDGAPMNRFLAYVVREVYPIQGARDWSTPAGRMLVRSLMEATPGL